MDENRKSTNVGDLEVAREWLAKASVRISNVLSSRSALRALPLVFNDKGTDSNTAFSPDWENLVLRLFRANLLCWSSSHENKLSSNINGQITNARRQLLSAFTKIKLTHAQLAVLAVSDASLCATSDPREAPVAAAHVLQTVTSGSYASNARRQALLSDVHSLVNGKSIDELLITPLWAVAHSSALMAYWHNLETALLDLDHDWDVWISWYIDRIYGRSMDAKVLRVWNHLPSDIWVGTTQSTNSFIKDLISRLPLEIDSLENREPELEPGPEFDITEQGLSLKASSLPKGDFDYKTQLELHDRLKRLAPLLADASQKAANTHRGLAVISAEYADLVSRPFEALEVTSLWAVGAGLLANRDAFARAHDSRLMTEPLEPNHFALLQQAAELHGGFILGFPLGRELAERADQSRLSGEAMEKVVSVARLIIEKLRNSRQIETRTREFLAAVEEGLIEPGWKITRAGYAAYVVTRNALIAIGKLLNWANSAFGTVVGAAALSITDPGLAHTQFWIRFVLENSSQILVFAEPFPELKIWLSSQIEAARNDSSTSKSAKKNDTRP